ncbi:ribonuclease D [Candidatus Cytomitobacter indipagum]|uniref:Ribonuclease D n=1 Tax=Candidatus Cytomitobacter indipagum TaxID=2601575 RepID=A0A5C0UDT9_9PROT|nr:ribonuclease D [Candidatus Cytomitobacter indipagum]QEK38216.1 ribonuclease D [Candidatus Cytomitobacter indipagum]
MNNDCNIADDEKNNAIDNAKNHVIDNAVFIDNKVDLDNFIITLEAPEIIYFDTEFHRRNTYWSTLCLIQLKINNKIAIIDAQKVEIKNTLIAEMFANSEILKVCHACEQDLNVLKHAEISIENCFDTQIAASFCQLGHNMSYQNLTKQIVDVELEKKYQDAIWNVRPLTKEMLEYAKYDVMYLDVIFKSLSCKLKNTNRYEWVKEEVSNIKYNPKKKSMIHLWRDKLAQKKNIPPGWILNNKILHSISCETDRNKIKSMIPDKLQIYLQDIMDILNSSTKQKDNIDANLQNALHILIKIIAENENIPASWLCSSEQVRFICANGKLQYKYGWRYEMLNQSINDFLNDKISISCKNNKMHIKNK